MANGNTAPAVLKTVPVTVAPVTDKLLPPGLEMITLCVELVFATTLPNETALGDTAICAGLAVTVIAALADFVASATLVAVSVYVPGAEGAVYRPDVVQMPAVPDHVTEVLLDPVTAALNCCVLPAVKETDPGFTVTATVDVCASTVIVAVADLLGSATLVAVRL
jgi:hypothetical protein